MLTKASYIFTAMSDEVEKWRPSLENSDKSRNLSGNIFSEYKFLIDNKETSYLGIEKIS